MTWLRQRPIIVGSDEDQQRRDDRTLKVWRTPTVHRDHGDDLASRVRKLLSQECERRVVARDAQRAAGSMRNPKDRDLVGPDVWTCGERRRSDERILRPLRSRDQRREVAYIDVSPRTEAIRQVRCIALGGERREPEVGRVVVGAVTRVQSYDDRKGTVAAGWFLELSFDFDRALMIGHFERDRFRHRRRGEREDQRRDSQTRKHRRHPDLERSQTRPRRVRHICHAVVRCTGGGARNRSILQRLPSARECTSMGDRLELRTELRMTAFRNTTDRYGSIAAFQSLLCDCSPWTF